MAHSDTIDLATLSVSDILVKRKGLRRRLSEQQNLQPIRIAVLGGSTSQELVDLLEVLLLHARFQPSFYQSEYGRFEVEAVHDSDAVVAFKPDIVYLHTSVLNIERFAPLGCSEAAFDNSVRAELARFEEIWRQLEQKLGCIIIQNNFELPPFAILGNLDASATGGHTRFVQALNLHFVRASADAPKLLLQDVHSISSRSGLDRWFDRRRWFHHKIVTTPEGSYALAQSLCALVRSLYGKTRKVLVLDLDNTLWGGVIGDDGVDHIQIGRETPLAEAYTAFQEYCLSLRNRGILLAVCSKNDEAVARQGFTHPDSILKLEHISCFRANWDSKHENIAAIAKELNLCADSFVFVDDNPAERALVAAQVEGIAVPDVGNDPAQFPAILEAHRYFEAVSLSREDIERAGLYAANAERTGFQSRFADYGEYLGSLEMAAEIEPFSSVYLDRITQLTNKTNQFNLTTRRYTLAEMQAVLADPHALGLYGRLTDRFGDNGLVAVTLARRVGATLEIDLWLMSCRVLKRDMELAMLDALVQRASRMDITAIRGRYLPTPKNGMVRNHYAALGFRCVSEEPNGSAVYLLDIEDYKPLNTHIRVSKPSL